MSSLGFLSPDGAATTGGFSPVASSSMERIQRDHGARFEERHGWRVPVSFPGESERLAVAGLVDLSHLGKLEVRGEGHSQEGGDVLVWYRCRPDLSVVVTKPGTAAGMQPALAQQFGLVLDQTGAWGALGIVGPQAPAVMRRITHLHEFPASGPVSHIAAHVVERTGGYWIIFPQEYGHSLWEIAADAAEPLGGGPVGVDAVQGVEA